MIYNNSLENYKTDPRWADKNFRACCVLVESKIVPRYLYKFMKANDNLIDNLKNNQLWFSSPKDFNDPFDCKINATSDMSMEEIDCLVQKLQISAKKSDIERILMKEAILKNPEEAKKLLNERLHDTLNSIGICCFSREKENILMWSHYADNHLGICLKFDVLEDHNLFFAGGHKPIGAVHNVEYLSKYPLFNPYDIMCEKAATREVPFIKSNNWMYEKEFRLISSQLNGIPFEKKALVEIIFGSRIDEAERLERKTKEDVLKVLNENNYTNISCFQARTSPNRYELEFEKILKI